MFTSRKPTTQTSGEVPGALHVDTAGGKESQMFHVHRWGEGRGEKPGKNGVMRDNMFHVKQGGHIVATDGSDEMLARVQERLDNDSVTLRQLNVTEPRPFGAHRFDAVVATLVLEHIDDLPPGFREVRRVLRDGGTLSFAELHPIPQFEGAQAHFEDEATGETVVIDAFTHPVSEFVDAGLETGFVVQNMAEWRAEGDEMPRLLTLRFGAGPDAAGS
ncbi:MAG: class I SAM-dependent methyltransferase [Salinibacter sp.]|uniref:class I SAM-dependent methyltransferase n=1 Tax=Salinibacter sp. TaxID=2065818 RepID=UPI002FC28917